jgi:hypothetical protein
MAYNIELDELRVEEDLITRDNIEAIRRTLLNIETILQDIDTRLEALE